MSQEMMPLTEPAELSSLESLGEDTFEYYSPETGDFLNYEQKVHIAEGLGRVSLENMIVLTDDQPPGEDIDLADGDAYESEERTDEEDVEAMEEHEEKLEVISGKPDKKQKQKNSTQDTEEQTRRAAYELIYMTTAIPVDDMAE